MKKLIVKKAHNKPFSKKFLIKFRQKKTPNKFLKKSLFKKAQYKFCYKKTNNKFFGKIFLIHFSAKSF